MCNTTSIIFAFTILSATSLSAWSFALKVNIDTTGLIGTNATLAFDFFDGDAAFNNTIQISQFQTNALLGSASLLGDVSGSLNSTVHIGDNDFDNRLEQQLILGSSLQFQLHTTNLFDINGIFPDSFAFYILDEFASFSLLPTTDPFGLDALFAIDLNGSENGLSVYTATTGADNWAIEPLESTVPTPSTFLLILAGVLSAYPNRKRRKR